MLRRIRLIAALPLLIALTASHGSSQPSDAAEELDKLAWLVGPPWVGTVGAGDNAAVDVSVWSWAVGGHALRNVHAVAGGAYGGETLLWWDTEETAYAFVYVTTGGFTTSGHLRLNDDGSLEGIEDVSGAGVAQGVDAVRTITRRGGSGELVIGVSYQRDGVWGPVRERVYARSEAASLPCELDPACIE